MRKTFLIAFLLCVGSLSALPIRNVAEPYILESFLLPESCCFPLGIKIGMDADYVFQYHFEVDKVSDNHKIEHAKRSTNSGFLAATLCDRFEVFSTLGSSRFYIKSNVSAFSPRLDLGLTKGQRLEIESSTFFSWSVGARGILWRHCNTFLGVEGEFFSAEPEVESVILQTTATAMPSDVHLRYKEGQFGIALVQDIAHIAYPYFGVKWSFASMRFKNAGIVIPGRGELPALTLKNLENSRNWGYAAGVTFNICKKFDLTFEYRMDNEEAIYINGQARF